MPSRSDDELALGAELGATADVLRRVTPAERVLETPPESIWAAIEAAVSADATDATDGPDTARAGTGLGAGRAATVVDLAAERDRRRPLTRWIGLAAAAVVVLVLGVGVVLAVGGEPGGDVLARADLARLDTAEVVGRAELVDTDDHLRLELDLPAGADPGEGYFELWLINDAVTELVSLGPVTGDSATLPDGLDPGAFPVVDVSFEPYDGDPAHSGHSLVRGRLSV